MPTLHRMRDDELAGVLANLAAGGGTARTPETWQADQMTALVLGELGPAGDAGGAVMPLARRTLHAMPGRSLQAGWISSNQFASRMGWRRRTRSTAAEWPVLLPELDLLLVMHRDEASLAARWYRNTGFEDVLSVRCLYLEMEAAPGARGIGAAGGGGAGRFQVQVISPADPGWPAWCEPMVAVYRDVFGGYGGPRIRHAAFWTEALNNHYYRDHYQFQVIGLWESASPLRGLAGYAVVGWSGWHSKRPRMDILELATRQWDTEVAAELIQTTCQLAWSKQVRQVRAVVSAHDPYRGHLARTGFVDRWGYRMLARWLHPQRYLERIAPALPAELGDLRLELRAPGEVPLNVMRGVRPAAPLVIQASPRSLTRLLLNRLDVAAGVQEGTLAGAATRLGEADVARLSAVFPWTPWAFHMLDYI